MAGKKFTNYTPGDRGITLKDGSVVWLKPGETVEVTGEVVGPLPDLGDKPAKQDDGDAALIDAVQAENADLKKQVAEQGKTITDLTAEIEKLKKKPA